jgi:hypothetical protein
MKREVLSRPEVQAWYRARFRVIAIDTRDRTRRPASTAAR